MQDVPQQNYYKGKVSARAATAVGLGAIIGAGIFVLSGTAIAIAGVYAIVSFLIVGLVAIIVAMELGELGSIMPRLKGGAYSYVYEAFGSELGFISGILLYFSFATGVSAVALGFGSYLASIFGITMHAFVVGFAAMLIVVLSFVNMRGIRKAAKADLGLVIVKLFILFIFAAAAVFIAASSKGGISAVNFSATAQQATIGAVFAASVAVLFAYSGFQAISTFTSEIEGGSRKAAMAVIYAVAISIVVYLAVIIALILLVPASQYTVAADPLSFALTHSGAPGWLSLLVDIGALIATTSATLALILSSSRVLYQIGENKLLPHFFRKYDRRKDVAVNGILLTALISLLMLGSGNIYIIAAISNFGTIFSYLINSIAIIKIRTLERTGRHKGLLKSMHMTNVRLFLTPLYPYIPIITTFLLLVFFMGFPAEALAGGVITILLSILIYYMLEQIKEKPIIKVKLFN